MKGCTSGRVLVLAAVVAFPLAARGAPYPFADDFESGLAQWTAQGSWGLTADESHSPSHAATDSPGVLYTNHTDAALSLGSDIDLGSAVRPVLRFYHRTAIEDGYDLGYVEVSTNSGAGWIDPPAAVFTGNRDKWTREQIDLAPYAGFSAVRIRFRLVTDYSVVKDGWTIDDIRIDEAPLPPVGLLATNVTTTSLALQWTASTSPDIETVHVYRSLEPPSSDRVSHRLDAVPAATTTFMDRTVNPKTPYYYWLMAVSSNDLHALSAEIFTNTPSGMDYPFLDDGEGGGGTWVADAPWALSTEDANSPTHAWSDSPGTNYANDIGYQSLLLSAPLDLSAATRPGLSFSHKYHFLSGDSAVVTVSTNGGASWDDLAVYENGEVDQWQSARFSLESYAGASAVLIRLYVTANGSGTADGWHVDDIGVGEMPYVVNAPAISDIESHAMRLTWAPNTNDLFSHYAVYRSTSSGVGLHSTLATSIYDRATVTFRDTGLALDTEYYYRVYAVSAYGVISPD